MQLRIFVLFLFTWKGRANNLEYLHVSCRSSLKTVMGMGAAPAPAPPPLYASLYLVPQITTEPP